MLDSAASGQPPDPATFAAELHSVMTSSRPFPVVHHGCRSSRVDPALSSATHVFLRVDAVKRPLVPPYEGPFQVLSRTDKTFVLLKRGKPVTVTIDRLKPAFFLPATVPDPSDRPTPVSTATGSRQPRLQLAPSSRPSSCPALPPRLPPPAPPVGSLDPTDWPLPTRYGRRPRPPARLNL